MRGGATDGAADSHHRPILLPIPSYPPSVFWSLLLITSLFSVVEEEEVDISGEYQARCGARARWWQTGVRRWPRKQGIRGRPGGARGGGGKWAFGWWDVGGAGGRDRLLISCFDSLFHPFGPSPYVGRGLFLFWASSGLTANIDGGERKKANHRKHSIPAAPGIRLFYGLSYQYAVIGIQRLCPDLDRRLAICSGRVRKWDPYTSPLRQFCIGLNPAYSGRRRRECFWIASRPLRGDVSKTDGEFAPHLGEN